LIIITEIRLNFTLPVECLTQPYIFIWI